MFSHPNLPAVELLTEQDLMRHPFVCKLQLQLTSTMQEMATASTQLFQLSIAHKDESKQQRDDHKRERDAAEARHERFQTRAEEREAELLRTIEELKKQLKEQELELATAATRYVALLSQRTILIWLGLALRS